MPHEHPLPGNRTRFARVLSENETTGYSSDRPEIPEDRLDEANLVTSEMIPDTTDPWARVRHRPVLDIDFEAKLIPSSTDGHYHLYLDKPMSWSTYRELLRALSRAGIIEPGYASASIERGYSAVRLPWVSKEPT